MNNYKKIKKKYKINWLEGVRKKRKIKVLYTQIGKVKTEAKNLQTQIEI